MITVITPVLAGGFRSSTPATAYDRAAEERLADAVFDLDRSLPYRREQGGGICAELPAPDSQHGPRPSYCDDGASGRRNTLHAGDIFQVVPIATLPRCPSPCRRSRSTARCAGSTRRRSCSILDFDGFSVVGSSPEILVRLRDGTW